jgi:hypothetical protein
MRTPITGMLRKMSGSFGKFTSASRRALQVKRTASVSDAMSWLRIESDIVRENTVNEITEKMHYDKRMLQEAGADWLEMYRCMTSPGGIFGKTGEDEYVRLGSKMRFRTYRGIFFCLMKYLLSNVYIRSAFI